MRIHKKEDVSAKQLCFFLAFLLPVSKLSEAPALLAYYAKDDLLLPAILHFILQAAMLCGVVWLSSKTKTSLFDLLEEKGGKFLAKTVYFLLAAYYVFFSVLPLLGLERFVYTAFFDSEPGLSAFAPFFFLAAYVATKNLQSFGRICEITMPLFLLAFTGLLFLSVGEADFSALMPLFSAPPHSIGLGALRSCSHFSDTALLLPFLGYYRYKKGDGKKLVGAYSFGAICVLFFLAVFYGVFGPTAALQPFAFGKIAGYFSGLTVIGRIDLLLVYLTTALLLFYHCLPIALAVHCFCRAANVQNKIFPSAICCLSLLLLTVFFNRLYGEVYSFVAAYAVWIFPLFAYGAPLGVLLLVAMQERKKRRLNNG